MNPNDLVEFSKHTIKYLELDLEAFEYVTNNRDVAKGGLGFAMVATAMAAFDGLRVPLVSALWISLR